jgi:alpha/beta superfamily hydrolase
MTEESVHFHAGEVRLEGRLAVPAGAARGAVVCHPHPQYGGAMDNNVVVAVCEALQAAGVATLRFNFRGVGGSQGSYADGRGEVDDARQAVAFLRGHLANGDITLAGYSFGAMMALLAGHDAGDVSRLVAIAPPVAMFDLGFLKGCHRPKLVVAGDRDQYCPLAELEAQLTTVAEPKSLVRIAGADHFFYGHEAAMADAVAKFIGERQLK